MNKHPHIELSPIIDELCIYFNITRYDLMNKPRSNKPDILKRLILSYLKFKVGATYQNIANEFNLKISSIFVMIEKADEKLRDNDPRYLEIQNKLNLYK